MRKIAVIFLVLFTTGIALQAQAEWAPAKPTDIGWAPAPKNPDSKESRKRDASKQVVSIGLLQGGGGLIGVDYEMLVVDRLGFQLGGGLFSYSAGINIHSEPTINSSFLSLAYWDLGAGSEVSMRLAGMSYNYRSKEGWLNWQIGLGKVLNYTSGFEQHFRDTVDADVPSVMLIYSIGGYFNL